MIVSSLIQHALKQTLNTREMMGKEILASPNRFKIKCDFNPQWIR